jgi:hypothetical protein
MRKILVGLWFSLQICSIWSLDIISGQAQIGSVTSVVTDSATTPNLITSPLSPVLAATAPGGFSGGSSVGYNSATNTYYFGYTQRTIATSIAINNALQGSGVKVNGLQYGMSYLNGGDSYGTLSMTVNVTSNTGATLQSYNHSFNTIDPAWKQFDQVQTFTNPYELANLGSANMSITGKDSRFWAGYYGPQVKDPYLKLTYGSDPKTYYSIPDDGYVSVPLQFGFPFYGNVYTQSYMFSNGVVGFLDPTTHGNNFCCDGVNLERNPGSQWNFAIYALQTDLIAANPNAKFWTQGSSSYQSYNWENINEYGTNNLNTFSATIRPSGAINLGYTNVNVQNHSVTIGIAGDISLGQFSQYYNGYGAPTSIPSTGINFTGTEVNLCFSDPLSSPSCQGYAAAYFTQQCTINALYSVDCPGYAAAYLTYQCSINPLYATTCEGYEQAYFNQQCSENPLYDSRCTGYAEAYQSQQCALDPLYSTTCTGYADAFYVQQCRLNPLYDVGCTGYAAAYKTQQCSLNALYATDCPGYAAAYKTQQCTANPLYATDCPGYAKAYFDQQCSLNGLYDRTCPNYSTAYATKMVLEQQNIASTVATAGTVAANAPASTTTATVSNDGSVTTTSATGNTTVDKALPPPATSANTSAAPAAPVQLVQQAPPPASPVAPQQQAQAERKPEGKPEAGPKQEGGPAGQPMQAQAPQGGDKPQQPTTRQALAERRLEAARKEAVEKGKNLANEVGKVKDLEAQKQIQGVVIAAMGFTPGFDGYGKAILPDAAGYKPFTVYNNQRTVDNARVGRGLFGPTDRLHNELVESQYTRGK